MVSSKLTSKYQATIPAPVRERLGLEKGDRVGFEIRREEVVLYRVLPMDVEYLRGIEETLSEWSSEYDDEAYGDL